VLVFSDQRVSCLQRGDGPSVDFQECGDHQIRGFSLKFCRSKLSACGVFERKRREEGRDMGQGRESTGGYALENLSSPGGSGVQVSWGDSSALCSATLLPWPRAPAAVLNP
jgi:hypothetical protein